MTPIFLASSATSQLPSGEIVEKSKQTVPSDAVDNAEDGAQFLEIGCWAGSTACSALYGNTVKTLCIDDWSQFSDPKTINPLSTSLNP